MGTRYVEVPATDLEGRLSSIGEAVIGAGGRAWWGRQGMEQTYVILPRRTLPCPAIVVYTTLAVGAGAARACGEDAVRIVVGIMREQADGPHAVGRTRLGFRPTAKSRRMLRTAPALPTEEERVAAFLDRFTKALRDAYKAASRTTPCPDCGSPMVVRRSKHGDFLGCTAFPACRGTRSLA